jgi:hypothetical protein
LRQRGGRHEDRINEHLGNFVQSKTSFPKGTAMFRYKHQPSHRHLHSRVLTILASVLLLALSTVSFSQAHSQPALLNSPSLQAALVAPRLDTVAVHGQGFTSGGLVKITIAGEDGSGLDRQVWTVASTEIFGPHGSMDPMSGYIAAGMIDTSIAVEPEVVWGPDGSMDPARGYDDPAQGSSAHASVPLCFQDFTVQAFDVHSGAQSSLVDVHAICSVTTGPPMA